MTERRLPLSLGNTGTSSDADENDLIQKGPGGIWVSRGPGEIIIAGRFLTRILHDVVGTFTHNLNARTTKFRVYGQAPGGGGGGADGQGAGTIGMGAPGSSGAYFDHIFTVAIGVTSFSYTVGGAGAGGFGNTPGSNGSSSTQVTYNAVTVGANPGGGGGSEDALNRTTPTFNPLSIPDGGTVIGSPNIGIPGQRGTLGFTFDNFSGTTGVGGKSIMGLPGAPRVANNGGVAQLDGFPGTLGAGGSPGLVASVAPSVGGGAGGAGLLIVEEYS